MGKYPCTLWTWIWEVEFVSILALLEWYTRMCVCIWIIMNKKEVKGNPREGLEWQWQHGLGIMSVHSWTKVCRFFFQRAVTSRWRGKSTICQFRNGNTSYFYKFVKCHRRRRNGHGPVPLNNEQRFKFAMSTYTRPAHHCDQRWTCVLTALRESHSGPNLQQFQLWQLSPRLTRSHGIVKFYIFIHNIEETKPGHQQFHSISHHE